MKVLVTGAEGFVGRHASSYLEGKGFTVLRTDLHSPYIAGDVSDERFVLSDLASMSFDAIVHLASIVDIQQTLADPYQCFTVNSYGTLNVLELASRKGVDRVIYASSANVYGVPLELPVKESTPFNPRVPYDYSKVVSEMLVESYRKVRGLPVAVLRSWKLFGEFERPSAAIPRFIRACLLGQPIPLYNHGRDTTDPYHVENFCRAVELCLAKEEAVGHAFNVGAGSELSIRQIAEAIKELTHSKSEFQPLPPRTGAEAQPMRSYPSIAKIEELLGYKPVVGFEEGLKRTVRWMSEQLGQER